VQQELDSKHNNPMTRGLVSCPGRQAVGKLEVLLFAGCVNSPYGLDGVSSFYDQSLREIADTKTRVSALAGLEAGLKGRLENSVPIDLVQDLVHHKAYGRQHSSG
jgi:hypothetical protein